MQYLRVKENDAEAARKRLMKLKLFDKQRRVEHSKSYVYFPIKFSNPTIKKLIEKRGWKVEPRKGGSGRKAGALTERLRGLLSKKEYEEATRGYDILGNIAIIDVPEKLKGKRAAIAKEVMEIHPAVKTVVEKAGAVSGKYRTRKFKHVAGENTQVATYRENGCTFVFDIGKTFFSNRLAFERSRIINLVKKDEDVVVMFAGIGPYAIEIAKAHPSAQVVGIELNGYAAKMMEKNAKLNKTPNVEVWHGDVGKAAGRYEGFADRIIVPMPTASTDFLDAISKVAKRKATVHLYVFGPSESVYKDTVAKVSRHAKTKGYKIDVIDRRQVRTYSAKDIEIVLDYKISKRRN